jgi:GT2 family glycosyltransferase
MKKLHVFTLNWNGKDLIERLYKTLVPVVESFNYKWWIKDNGSKDGSVEYLKSIQGDSVDVLYCSHNTDSFAAGMNILFERAKSEDEDLILLLNNDVYFGDTTSIIEMNKLLTPDTGQIGARILIPNSNLLQHAGVYFSKKYNYFPYHYKHHEPSDFETEQNRELQAVTAALTLLRAGDYRKVCTTNKSGRNGMDERYYFAFEDIDLSLSIKYLLKKKIYYCGKTKIYHEESASLKKNPKHKIMMDNNVKLFRDKWFGVYKKDD